MAKKIKTEKGTDEYYYPYTSPDLVIDKNGKNITNKFEEFDIRFEDIEKNQIELIEDDTSMEGISDTTYSDLETIDKTLIGSINEINSQCKDIVKKLL